MPIMAYSKRRLTLVEEKHKINSLKSFVHNYIDTMYFIMEQTPWKTFGHGDNKPNYTDHFLTILGLP